jgi:hypothetical protein
VRPAHAFFGGAGLFVLERIGQGVGHARIIAWGFEK